ncbi:Rrf2 family transcriptional regulator [Streptomyces armeniacus]|uniref:Rrf2 family transcriptional regulator n=1 Tax=Streptomyces armeniacus TaxID=83291 RepID=UPI001AD7EC16|nr:Rrf2 family transcriptional regulator [Streptomyces armeniacus]
MAAAVPSFPDPGSGPQPSTAGTDRYEPRFLLWLWQRTDGELDLPVPSDSFAARQNIPESTVRAVADRLRGHGLIRTHEGPGEARTDLAPAVSLRAAGADHARWLQARRADPAERGRFARTALLGWIFAQSDRRPLRIEEFFDSGEIFFLGEALSGGEVARTAAYLAEAELIACEGPLFQGRVGSHVSLTQLGVDCVLTGADVGRYVAQWRQSARPVSNTYVDTVVGTVHGDVTVQPLSTVELADLVEQFAPALVQDEESLAALLRSADALREGDDPHGGAPDRHHQQGLLERIRSAVGGSPDSVGRQVVLDAVGQAMQRLMG